LSCKPLGGDFKKRRGKVGGTEEKETGRVVEFNNSQGTGRKKKKDWDLQGSEEEGGGKLTQGG